MNLSKEEIGATAAAAIFAAVVIIAFLRGVGLGESAFRGAICAAIASQVFQFIGGIWVKGVRKGAR